MPRYPEPEQVEMIEARGTREAITNALLSDYMNSFSLRSGEVEILKQYANCLFEAILEEYAIRSDIENVFSPEQYRSTQDFITPEKTYYISLKKSTLILLSVFSKLVLSHIMGDVTSDVIAEFIATQFPQEDLALIHRLDNASGEVCLLMEAAREKNGIDKNCLARFRGECVNHHLACQFRRGDKCGCDRKQVTEICETLVKDRVLRKEGRRYYYTDFV